MKHLFVYHDGNGQIREDDFSIEEIDEQVRIEDNFYGEMDENLSCHFPLNYLKKFVKQIDEKATQTLLNTIEEDLIAECEDNEVMAEAIRTYFEQLKI